MAIMLLLYVAQKYYCNKMLQCFYKTVWTMCNGKIPQHLIFKFSTMNDIHVEHTWMYMKQQQE